MSQRKIFYTFIIDSNGIIFKIITSNRNEDNSGSYAWFSFSNNKWNDVFLITSCLGKKDLPGE